MSRRRALPWWRSRPRLLGPLYFYDLLRLARRGRSTLLRTIYALTLLGGFYLTYTSRFPQHDLVTDPFGSGPTISVSQRSRLAATFGAAILVVQNLAVIVLTPAYLASAIAEEKERRTLELLFTTHLDDREIVLGKLFSRLTHLALILLAGLPILSLMLLFGGLDTGAVLAGFAVSALTLLSVGSVSILFSVLCRDVLAAVLASYATVALVGVGCAPIPGGCVASPPAMLMEVEREMGTRVLQQIVYGAHMAGRPSARASGPFHMSLGAELAGFAVVHVLIAAGCSWVAVARLRRSSQPRVRETIPVAPPPRRRDRENGPAPRKTYTPPPVGRRFRVGDHSLLWKEVYHGAGEPGAWKFRTLYLSAVVLGLLLVGLAFMMAYPLLGSVDANEERTVTDRLFLFLNGGVNPTLRTLGIILAAVWATALGLRMAGGITREREQRTLDGLVVLPVQRADILGAKWLGGILRYRQCGYLLAAVWTVGLLCGAIHPVGVLLTALACAVHLAFVASLGLWLSLVSRNSLWSNCTMVLMLLLMFVGWWVVMVYSRLLVGTVPGQNSWWGAFGEIGLNPARTWWYLGFSWQDFGKEVWGPRNPLAGPFGATLAGLGLFAAVAGALWLASCSRFAREHVHEGKG